LGLGRLVSDKKGPFVGREALAEERVRGPRRRIVGLEINWNDIDEHFTRAGLTPQVPVIASRVAVPVYSGGRQVGKATSTAWSPTLKRLIALATIDAPHFAEGRRVEVEVTVEATRRRAGATIVPTPFYNPPQKTVAPPV